MQYLKVGDPVFLDGPLDFVIGIVEAFDGAFLVMRPGCASTRDVVDKTAILATGKPCGTHYCKHPRVRLVPWLAITGIDLLPQFNEADWPSEG